MTSGPGGVSDTTFGVRVKGAVSAVDYTGELAVQSGDYATDAVAAQALAVAAGYTFEMDWKPRVGIEFARASGDKDPADGKRQTFDPLFSFGHAFHGFYDVAMWRNVRAFMLALKAQPSPAWTLGLDVHVFKLDHAKDAWTSVPLGAVIRRDSTGNAGTDLGKVVDLHARAKLNDRADVWIGVSRFMPGSFVSDTGDDPAGTWAFCQMTLKY